MRPRVWLQREVSYTLTVSDAAKTATEAVALALESHRAELQAFVQRRTSSHHVEDVLQAAAMRALEKAGSLKDPERALPWLYQIHRTTLVDAGRKMASRRNYEEPEIEAAELEPVVASDEEHCSCSSVQAKTLKPSYSEILHLVDVEGHSITEAANRLEVSVNNGDRSSPSGPRSSASEDAEPLRSCASGRLR